MNVIPPRIHGVIDYVVGGFLLLAPWLLGFSDDGTATWVTVGFGIAAVGYSLITDYDLGVVGLLSMRAHLGIDVVWCLGLLASPWVFGFADRMWWPHALFAVAGLAVVGLTGCEAGAGAGANSEPRHWRRSRTQLERAVSAKPLEQT